MSEQETTAPEDNDDVEGHVNRPRAMEEDDVAGHISFNHPRATDDEDDVQGHTSKTR